DSAHQRKRDATIWANGDGARSRPVRHDDFCDTRYQIGIATISRELVVLFGRFELRVVVRKGLLACYNNRLDGVNCGPVMPSSTSMATSFWASSIRAASTGMLCIISRI